MCISPKRAVRGVKSVGRLLIVVEAQFLVIEDLPETQSFIG